MKTRLVLLALLTVPAFVYACGGDDSVVDDGGTDGTFDTGPGNDGSTNKDGTANDTGTGNDTGTTNDSGGNDTGTTNDSGGSDGGTITDSGSQDSSTSFQCQKPSDCTNQFCCGSITFSGGGFQPNCTFVDASSQCSSTCKSSVSLQCAATDTVRTCTTHAECADAGTGYTDCCTVPFADASAEFCWSKSYMGFVNGMTCL